MDAMGFPSRISIAIGQWQTKKTDLPIDTEGELVREKFSGPRELQQFIINEKSLFPLVV